MKTTKIKNKQDRIKKNQLPIKLQQRATELKEGAVTYFRRDQCSKARAKKSEGPDQIQIAPPPFPVILG